MVYSFDIFDTLITRTTATPIGIFLLMQHRLLNEGSYLSIPMHIRKNFCKYRIDAENEARRSARRRNWEDVTLDMIYEHFAYMNYLPAEEIERMKALELIVELENSVPIFSNIEKVKRLQPANDVYLLSDMYLPVSHIRNMLVNIDPVFEQIPILVSGEINMTKGSGKLYSYFIDKYSIDVACWTHIGDNMQADKEWVDKLGGKSCIIQNRSLVEYENELLRKYENKYVAELMIGTVHNIIRGAQTASERVGMHTGGPILYGYVLWVIQEAIRQKIQILYFIARDGFVLKRIADYIIQSQNLDIRTKYLYGSRRAWRLPALCSEKERLKAWVEEKFFFNSFDEMLELLHVNAEDMAKYIPDILQRDKYQYDYRMIQNIKQIILTEQDLFDFIYEKLQDERKIVNAYLQQEIEDKAGGFVELNGTGFTQCCLQELTKDFYKYPVVSFFYSMTEVEVKHAQNNRFFKYTYEQLPINDIVEILTRAPHGQTIGYCQDESKKWKPILDEHIKEYPEEIVYDEYVKGVLAFASVMSRFDFCKGEELTSVSLDYVQQICTKPEVEVQDFVGDMFFSTAGTQKGTMWYAPKLTDEQIDKIYRDGVPVKECYRGGQIKFSLLRLTPEQEKRIEGYKQSDFPAKTQNVKRKYFSLSQDVKGDIALYGAGKRGVNVYNELIENSNANVVIWVDKNYLSYEKQEREILSPQILGNSSFDYVVIGIADIEVVKQVRQELIELGIPGKKILW